MPRLPVKGSASSVATVLVTCFHSRSFLWATAQPESGWPWGWRTATWRCCTSPSRTSTSFTCTRAACCRSSSPTAVSERRARRRPSASLLPPRESGLQFRAGSPLGVLFLSHTHLLPSYCVICWCLSTSSLS